MKKILLILSLLLLFSSDLLSQSSSEHSVARQWNDALLEAIRRDFARPTVHARNLFHSSVAMYDAWAAYDETAETFMLGKKVGDFAAPFNGIGIPTNIRTAQEEAMSYAVYRVLTHRFRFSPGAEESLHVFDQLMTDLGYDITFTSQDYSTGSPAAFGNYIGQMLIDFGLQDGANEQKNYANEFYYPINGPMAPTIPGSGFVFDFNRWQPLTLDVFIDQGGNPVPFGSREFLGAEWGKVVPFSLQEEDLDIYTREDYDYWVYNDPGAPPYTDVYNGGPESDEYKWGFSLVSIWGSHLDPDDTVRWDISPASLGNIDISSFPTTFEGYHDFYDYIDGGDPSKGHALNPHTGQPYEPQYVKRSDYGRVLAEFWADGPDSETPPGHWFTILNYVNDHPASHKKFKGQGEDLDDLEWDVKAYFILAGTMHDAAISAWGIKGWYDYLRPITAIRSMAGWGQSSDSNLVNYHPGGIPLVDGYIELVESGDSLAGFGDKHVGKIKLYTWLGPDYISDPDTDVSGVGWILAENWWPYQRPSFVTPPFAGFVSGHSTFSRAAAEVMTILTGDEFFPGGMGEFVAKKNEFLVFEEGPSEDVVLQWATYRDASDQTSLSRIWGGIHPPADDIPGRLIGEKISVEAFAYAEKYFDGNVDTDVPSTSIKVYPNPITQGDIAIVELGLEETKVDVELFNLQGQKLSSQSFLVNPGQNYFSINTTGLSPAIYIVRVKGEEVTSSHKIQVYPVD